MTPAPQSKRSECRATRATPKTAFFRFLASQRLRTCQVTAQAETYTTEVLLRWEPSASAEGAGLQSSEKASRKHRGFSHGRFEGPALKRETKFCRSYGAPKRSSPASMRGLPPVTVLQRRTPPSLPRILTATASSNSLRRLKLTLLKHAPRRVL